MNINEGRGGDIVKVLDNRIIGKVDQRPRDKGEGGESGGRSKTGLVGWGGRSAIDTRYCIIA